MKVLVAEDDLTLRQMVGIMLSTREIPCLLVEDGQGAVEAWESGDYDLILMDVQMPAMNGLEATRIIREKEKLQGGHVPIVAMTAHARAEDQEICRTAGMDDYISKPIDFDLFYALVDRYGGDSASSG
jgi:two-component system, OmpR family, response regulator